MTENPTNGESLVVTRIGLPYGTRLATWDAAGTALIWEVPQELVDMVGRGLLPRTDAGEGVTVEALVVDQDQQVLRGADEGEVWAAQLLSEPGAPTDNAAFREQLRQIVVEAARRGESVIIARGGLAEFDVPAARSSVVLDDGDWVSVVEAFPPITFEGWAAADHDDQASRLTAPAAEDTLMGAAMLLLMAASTFTHGPELVGLYFEDAPDGPWTG